MNAKIILLTAITICSIFHPSSAQIQPSGWKNDINFMPVGYQHTSHIYKGVMDNQDHSYLLQLKNNGSGDELLVGEYLPDGTSGFTHPVFTPFAQMLTTGIPGHNGGGIAVDDNFVYVAKENHPTNIAATGYVDIVRIDKSNPAAFIPSLNLIYGDFYVTDLKVKNNFMYVYGTTDGVAQNSLQFHYAATSTVIPTNYPTSIVAKYDLSGGAGNPSLVWVKKVFQFGASQSGILEIDDAGNVYASGSASNNSQLGTTYTVTFPNASQAATVVRLNASGDFDPTFAPIVIANHNNVPVNTLHQDYIDDLKLDPKTNHLYITTSDLLRKYEITTSASPVLTWSTTVTYMDDSRIAISACNEMYVTGTTFTPIPGTKFFNSQYFTQSFSINSGNSTSTLVSTTYNTPKHTQGEVVLIQSDGDKFIAGDYAINSGTPSIDFDQSTALNNPTYPVITFNTWSTHGSFTGIYSDGVKGDLVNDFKLTDAAGNEQYVFTCGEEIFFNGTACMNETNHYMDVWRAPGTSTSFQWYGGFGWLGGEADVKNLSQMAANHPSSLEFVPGYTYRVKLAVQNACTGWSEKVVTFTVTSTTITANFNSFNTNTQYIPGVGNVFDVAATSVEPATGMLHLWWIYDNDAQTLVSFYGWTPDYSHTFYQLMAGKVYSLVHVIKDPSGCAAQQNSAHYVGQFKSAQTSQEFTPAMQQILEDIESGVYGELSSWDNENSEGLSSSSSEAFDMYPNPAADYVSIKNRQDQNASLVILSADGRIIREEVMSPLAEMQLQLNELPEGMYMIRMVFENGSSKSRQLIKRR